MSRFNSVDPKAEKYYSTNPYVSMNNNPSAMKPDKRPKVIAYDYSDPNHRGDYHVTTNTIRININKVNETDPDMVDPTVMLPIDIVK